MHAAATRRFFLSVTPDRGRPMLAPGEQEHAVRVLRLAPGDVLLGIDGRGRAWPLRVSASGKRTLELEQVGELLEEPEPGLPAATCEWIELALSPPRAGRAEEFVDRVTQLGAAAVRWIHAARTPPRARELSPHRGERLRRAAAEASKQCRRLWLPELHAPVALAELVRHSPGALVLLDPAPTAPPLWEVLAALEPPGGASWTRARPLVLLAGPEGGFEPAEERALEAAGARRALLGPLVLRIETALEAALAITVQRGLLRRGEFADRTPAP